MTFICIFNTQVNRILRKRTDGNSSLHNKQASLVTCYDVCALAPGGGAARPAQRPGPGENAGDVLVNYYHSFASNNGWLSSVPFSMLNS